MSDTTKPALPEPDGYLMIGVAGGLRPIGMVAYGELVARAVIAEYERANGISKGEQA